MNLLGIIMFGKLLSPKQMVTKDFPSLNVNTSVFDAATIEETFISSESVTYGQYKNIKYAQSNDLVFGCIEAEQLDNISLDAVAHEVYLSLFDLIAKYGYNYLVRVWNYVPNILEEENGMERYRRFNCGRHEAFVSKNHGVEQSPAANCVGVPEGPLSVYFLACKRPGIPLENPRQTSAYRYPQQYGPRSPTFSRATLTELNGTPLLFISGTASVVGHESLHPDDVLEQTRETMTNIEILLEQAAKENFMAAKDGLYLKVYIKYSEHFSLIKNYLETLNKPAAHQIVYMQCDLCRPELLVEIEGFCLPLTSNKQVNK
ncbi:unnamed protein product [Didymodactylos carnosus]|uniref:Chorismatase FkbO/Hyg5-like N-terminal domain-containing protein n=1 Tax=Didymodactylos carnosus TaxID=1234261 RepID=A0A8S2F6E1_9BILA|nr:unnamed protein product [Didymodactylos carnosus]CAF4153631.1 unnamed protein product [Didymodactylos carnosus]